MTSSARAGSNIRPASMYGRSMVRPYSSPMGGKPVPASGQQDNANPNETGNSLTAATSGSARTLPQSKPGWLASTVTVVGSVPVQSRSTALFARRAPAAAASTVAVASATSKASTSSDRQRRRESSRSQVTVIRISALFLLGAQDVRGAQPGGAAGGPGGQQVGGQQGQRRDQQQRQRRPRRAIGQRRYVGGGVPQDPSERDAQRDPEGQSDEREQGRLRADDQPGLPPGQPQRPQHGQFMAATADGDGQRMPDGPDGQHGEESAQRQRQRRHVPYCLDLGQRRRGREGERLPALDGRRRLVQTDGDRLDVRARPHGDHGKMELEGVVRAPEQAVVSGQGEPRALVVVVRALRYESDTGHGQRSRSGGAGQPDHRAGGRVQFAGGGGGEHDLVRR